MIDTFLKEFTFIIWISFFAENKMSFNPWLVGNIQSFLYLNCPECSYRTKKKDSFQEHALQNHPMSCSFFEEDKFKMDPFQNNDFIDDYASEQEVFKSDETQDDLCLFSLHHR